MKKLLLLFVSFVIYTGGYAQNGLWVPANEDKVALLDKTDRVAMPSAFHLFNLNVTQLKAALALAPQRDASTSSVIIQFPDGDGILQNYRIYEASVMDDELAAKHPEIKSYVGQGIENPAATVRFSTTIFGVHAMILSPQGTVYTDPYTTDLKNYIVYKKEDLFEDRGFTCGVTDEHALNGKTAEAEALPTTTFSNDGILRTFRLAMACTVEYARYHYGRAGLTNGTETQKKAAVLAAMNVTMTRVNGVYEKDLAITMRLVANNEAIIFITSDNLNNDNADRLISDSQSVITSTIRSTNFDIGHTVSTGGGGLALLGVICADARKASGITGSGAPVGDPYDIDFVAHEMGHQFGADHTFAGKAGSCGGNGSPSTAVEPGSGTTIMAYAGICGAANIQAHSDAYFHAVSLNEIFTYIRSTSCAVTTTLNNAPPVISALTSYTIPYSTAFVLKGGDVTDVNNDALTYCWEQTDGVAKSSQYLDAPTATAVNGPNFRSFAPVTVKDRYIPVLSSVLSNNLIPAWEKTPSVARRLTFALTVRDNRAGGGQTSRANMTVNVSGAAGAFKVTSQNTTGITWPANTQQTVTWDVAGTDGNNINTANVNILLSTNGGLTFSTVLAAATANDGNEVITVPALGVASNCRIKIEPVDNIYYAVNTTAFAVSGPLDAETFGLENFSIYPNPNNGSFVVTFASATQNKISIAVYDMRGREVFTNSYTNTGLFTGNINLNGAQAGVYMVNVQDGNHKEVRKVVVR